MFFPDIGQQLLARDSNVIEFPRTVADVERQRRISENWIRVCNPQVCADVVTLH